MNTFEDARVTRSAHAVARSVFGEQMLTEIIARPPQRHAIHASYPGRHCISVKSHPSEPRRPFRLYLALRRKAERFARDRSMRYTDVAIVGGGLAGSIIAATLGRAGIDAVLIDPH